MASSSATTCIAKSVISACAAWSSWSTGISELRARPKRATSARISSCSRCCCPTSMSSSPYAGFPGQQLVHFLQKRIGLDRLLEERVHRHELVVLPVHETGHLRHAG